MVLDTSVALPMLFGLEYQAATSRYAVGASTLLEVCRAHEIPIMVPRPYVNEMAAHGIRAIEFLEKYESLPENLKPFLRGSGNAYLSHYSHIQEAMTKSGFELTTLLHVDERQVEKLARKIETIQTPSQAHRLSLYIEQARSESGDSWLPDVDDLSHFLDSSSPDETSAVVGDL